VTFYASNPDAGPTEVGRAIGVSRQTVYNYLAELEAAGRIARNDGKGVAVLKKGGDG
jgi:DNA-binding GntR family transcriptional regulator